MPGQDEFIEQHGGELTPELAAQLLDMEQGEGDTGNAPESGTAPDVPATVEATGDNGAVVAKQEQADTQAQEASAEPANAVLLARDRVHTIPYEKLVEARSEAQDWKAKADAALIELEQLKQSAQARAEAGQAPTVMDNKVAAAENAIAAGVDPELFGDFSEEALTAGIQKLVDARVAEVAKAIEAKVSKVLDPLQQKQEESATDAYFAAIYEKHPDLDSIAESQELADWIKSQPSFLQGGYRTVMQQGTAPQVIEMLDLFKQATGKTQTPPATDSVKAAAAAAVASARTPVPASLSEIPGGTPVGTSPAEAMANMTGPELLEYMQNKGFTPEQIESYLNSRV